MNKKSRIQFALLFSLSLNLLLGTIYGQEAQSAQSAYQVWSDLSRSGVLKDSKKLFVHKAKNKSENGELSGDKDNQNIVTYGGEKEGSSSKITRIMGPK